MASGGETAPLSMERSAARTLQKRGASGRAAPSRPIGRRRRTGAGAKATTSLAARMRLWRRANFRQRGPPAAAATPPRRPVCTE